MRFTSYGSAIESLVVALKPARDEVYKKHYSTPRYFVEYNLAVHTAFENWCYTNGIDKKDMNDVRIALTSHAIKYRIPSYMKFECLHTHLPDAFNVRGVWTPR